MVNKLRNLNITEDRIRKNDPFLWFCFSHFYKKLLFLFLVAYHIFNKARRLYLLNLISLSNKLKLAFYTNFKFSSLSLDKITFYLLLQEHPVSVS